MKIRTILLTVILPILLFTSLSNQAEKDYAREYLELYGIKTTNQFAQQAIKTMPNVQQAKSKAIIRTSMPTISSVQEMPVESVKTTFDNTSFKKLDNSSIQPLKKVPSTQTVITRDFSNKGNYSIQILVTSSERKMKKFITNQQLGKGTWVEKVENNGKFLYKIMYGHYVSRTEATLDIKKLPTTVLALKPWIRYIK